MHCPSSPIGADVITPEHDQMSLPPRQNVGTLSPRFERLLALAAQPDTELCNLYQSGEADATHALLYKHIPMVISMAEQLRREASVDLATEDLVHEGICTVLEAGSTYMPDDHTSFRKHVQKAVKQRMKSQIIKRLRASQTTDSSPELADAVSLLLDEVFSPSEATEITEPPIDEVAEKAVLARQTEYMLLRLGWEDPFYARVLKGAFGIGQEPQTHRQISEALGPEVSAKDVREGKKRALRTLRHSTYATRLLDWE